MPTVGFHGVRGSCPCSDPAIARYGGSTACVTVDPGDGTPPVIFDLGTGCRALGESLLKRYFPGASLPAGSPPRHEHEAPAPSQHDHIRLHLNAFVSHLHFDHVQGLPFFGPALRPDVRLDVYGPVQDDSLADAFDRFIQPPYFPVGVAELAAEVGFFELGDGGQVQAGPSQVTAREIPHTGRTLGYRLDVGGVSIAYLGDHQAPHSDGHVLHEIAESAMALCHNVDLLIHDAQYTDEEFARKSNWGHSTIQYAVEVAKQAGARKLALFHHDPTHDDDMLDKLASYAAELTGGHFAVTTAAEGMTIDVQPAGSIVGAPAGRVSATGA